MTTTEKLLQHTDLAVAHTHPTPSASRICLLFDPAPVQLGVEVVFAHYAPAHTSAPVRNGTRYH